MRQDVHVCFFSEGCFLWTCVCFIFLPTWYYQQIKRSKLPTSEGDLFLSDIEFFFITVPFVFELGNGGMTWYDQQSRGLGSGSLWFCSSIFRIFLTYLHFWWLEPPFTFSQSNMAMEAMAQLVQWFTHRTWRSWLYSYVTKYEVHAMVKSPPFFPTFWLVKSPIPRIFFSDKAGRCRSPGIFPPCLTGAPGCQHRHAAPQRAAAGAGRAAENGTRVREAGVLQQSGFVSIEQWSRPLLVDEWGLY